MSYQSAFAQSAKDSTVAKLTTKNIDNIELYGNSYGIMAGLAQAAGWPNLLAYALGVGLANRSISGSMATSNSAGGDRVIANCTASQTGAGAKPLRLARIAIYGTNEAGYGVPTATFIKVMRTIIRRMQATAIFEHDDAIVGTTGTWTVVNTGTTSYSGGSMIKATVTGGTITITTPSWWTGGKIVLGSNHDTGATTPFAATNGGTFGVTLDGVAKTSWVTGGAGAQGTTGLLDSYELDVPSGVHAIVLTVTAVTSEIRFDWIGFLPSSGTHKVIVPLPPRPAAGAAAAYSGLSPAPTDASLQAACYDMATQLDALVTTIAAEAGADVTSADLERTLNRISALFQTDQLHPNALAQLGMARTILRAIGEAAVREIGALPPYGEDNVITAAARTASGGTTGLGSAGYGKMRTLVLSVDVTAVSGTSPTLQVIVEGRSPQLASWNTVLDTGVISPPVAGAGKMVVAVDGGWPDILRARWVIGGTTPSINFSAQLAHKP